MKKIDLKPLISTAIILDTRRPRVSGLYPVRLRVIFQRKAKYYNLKINLCQEDFDKTVTQRPRGEYKQQKLYFEAFEKKALDVIDSFDDFSFEIFENAFFSKATSKDDVFAYYENYINELSKNNRIGTAESYKASISSIKKFINKDTLSFKEITVKFLNEFENYMVSINRSLTTVGIRLRCLRKLFNDYIDNNDLPKNKLYPFAKHKYQIPQGKKTKKALNSDDLKKVFEYQPETENNEQFAHDMFIFSYLSNGINISDILRLKHKDIDGDKILFVRQKTKNTTKGNQKEIEILLTNRTKEIIKRWSTKTNDSESYIFSYLQNTENESQKRNIIKNATKTINKYLKRIGVKLELNLTLTTYVARHSYATMLKRKGVPTEYISDTLGHNSLKTTQNYLDSFEDKIKQEYTKLLTDF